MNYTEKQLEENYTAFLKFIEDNFEGERQEKMLHMYGTDEGCLGLRALVAFHKWNNSLSQLLRRWLY